MSPERPGGPGLRCRVVIMRSFVLITLVFTAGRLVAQERIDAPPRYAAAVRSLEAFIAREVKEKQLPALSVALVDDQETVWAAGFGQRDPQSGAPATAATVYRVAPGS